VAVFKRGAVLHVIFPHTDGGEKPRYVLVVGDESAYADSEDVVVVKISSTNRPGVIPLAGSDRRGTNLADDSFVHPAAIQTIHQDFVNRIMGAVSAKFMQTVDESLRRYLGLS
jgi:mRNA-degrading endonuclease toxin of MazEF toxin-antitoxin module